MARGRNPGRMCRSMWKSAGRSLRRSCKSRMCSTESKDCVRTLGKAEQGGGLVQLVKAYLD